MQGAVINVVTRQGSERFFFDASYWWQTAGLTAPARTAAVPGAGGLESGYERDRYRDFTTSLGGPAIRDRLWFFTGYQHLRDYDSQPGASPAFPRTYEQNKIFAKLTWKLAAGLAAASKRPPRALGEPELPTMVKPFEATTRSHASVPAITFGDLTHASASNTLWDVRVGRIRLPPRRRTEHGRSDDGEPVRPGRPVLRVAVRKPSADRTSFAPAPRRRSVTSGPDCGLPITSGRSADSSIVAITTSNRSFRRVCGSSTTADSRFSPSLARPRTKAGSPSRPPGSGPTP